MIEEVSAFTLTSFWIWIYEFFNQVLSFWKKNCGLSIINKVCVLMLFVLWSGCIDLYIFLNQVDERRKHWEQCIKRTVVSQIGWIKPWLGIGKLIGLLPILQKFHDHFIASSITNTKKQYIAHCWTFLVDQDKVKYK